MAKTMSTADSANKRGAVGWLLGGFRWLRLCKKPEPDFKDSQMLTGDDKNTLTERNILLAGT